MPDRSDRVLDAYDEAGKYELPYISKSRVEQWLKNPEHVRLKYLEGIEEPETEAMVRGTRVHEAFEGYYETILDQPYMEPNDPSIQAGALPDNRQLWADFVEPYVSNFFTFERRRWDEAGHSMDDYSPVAIEEERWREPLIDNGPEWMGLADVVLPAASVVEIQSDDGVVVVDFKTGSVPDKQYRSPGIYTELAYYTVLFEDEYDVAGSMAYYPRSDESIVNPDDGPHRDKVFQAVEEMVAASEAYDGSQKFEAKEGPLCGWSPSEDDRSPFYGVCSQCTWNVPVQNQNTFEQLVEEGYSDREIAEHLGCSPNAAQYWRYKLDV